MQTAKAELGWKKNPNVSLKQDNTRVVKPPHLLPERRIDITLPELSVPLKVKAAGTSIKLYVGGK